MYIIELLATVSTFIIAYNSYNIIKKIYLIDNNLFFLLDFYNFIFENHMILGDEEGDVKKEDDNKEEKDIKGEKDDKMKEKFENKYLEKFKKFPNEFLLSELELQQENDEFEKIKRNFNNTRLDTIHRITERLLEIKNIQEHGNITNINTETKDELVYTKNINKFGINGLLEFFDLEDEDPEDIDFEELCLDLIRKKVELENELKEAEESKITDEEIQVSAREIIINQKLDKYMDNYVLEYTPLGNIYMRYNNSKKSFEYFSNNTIPYRYLEPVARKYVMTYWCKPLFVDIEEELKKAETKLEQEKVNEEKRNEEKKEEIKNGTKNVMAKLKSYNKETKNQNQIQRQMKNRSSSNFVLPPQIKANLPNINTNSEKQLLKENANRYTWEGRLTNFCPLKKIDKKILDKKLALTYADFKRIQQNK